MILAVESSCDESALAVWDPRSRKAREWLTSQIDLHADYGGVVPELASREHLQAFPLLLEAFLKDSEGETPQQIAVTRGPGLAPCLALGIALAKALSLRWSVPVVGVNHLRAHLFSPFMIAMERTAPRPLEEIWEPLLPHLGLLVSGGNTLLARFDGRAWTVLAQTEDDAAGEALDKGAKLLGLPYPGGPQIEEQARSGNGKAFPFPVSHEGKMRGRFSFSGLKTSLRYQLESMSEAEVLAQRPHLCASYQEAVIGQLVRRCREEIQGGEYRSLGLSGGVANNQNLREALLALAAENELRFLPAERRHTGDNASMIAFTAWVDNELQIESSEAVLAPSLGAGDL